MALSELRRKFLLSSVSAFRRKWRKLNLRGVAQADAHRRLNLLYKIQDPWNMESECERFRFVETNRILNQTLITPASRLNAILEIGCGEGHQSQHLAGLCERLTGIDVSPTAIARARLRLPNADFTAGDLFAQSWAEHTDRFDVVTAFEVLYYLKDIPRTLQTMSNLGKSCIVTYHVPSAWAVEPSLKAITLAGQDSFRFENTEWRVAWWKNSRP